MPPKSQKITKETMAEVASLVTTELLLSEEFKAAIEKTVFNAIQKKVETIHDLLDKMESRCYDLEQKVDETLKENIGLKQKISQMGEAQQRIQNSMNDMEQYSRRNNVRIFGIKENEGENICEMIKSFAEEKLSITLEDEVIDRCHRVGRNYPGTSHRPILVKFTSYQHKQKLIKARRKLKATGIVIKEDLTQENAKLLHLTQKKEKVKNCWTIDGRIIALVKTSDQQETKININSSTDLLKL
ncbi:hypothetical protein BSL78_08363 [Apostichopus japonicus]|uniref:Uncharacterized protein n=1 Tax=Stichopus japonicus TaxID=307972 RepID=A0A2G8L391_STIJA|nr:hypothetical protein BSL78_08363 [Apostichopus japonicus]